MFLYLSDKQLFRLGKPVITTRLVERLTSSLMLRHVNRQIVTEVPKDLSAFILRVKYSKSRDCLKSFEKAVTTDQSTGCWLRREKACIFTNSAQRTWKLATMLFLCFLFTVWKSDSNANGIQRVKKEETFTFTFPSPQSLLYYLSMFRPSLV